MECPNLKCLCEKTKVITTKSKSGIVIRERICIVCGKHFYTEEKMIYLLKEKRQEVADEARI